MRPRIGLVVPALEKGGGVPAVALFVRRAALASGRYDVRVASLATARNDERSVRITAPSTWSGGAASTEDTWSGVPFKHAGAIAPEFEFQRYRPRAALTHLVTDCDLIQVVCGSPAWANSVIGINKPVAMHVATLAKVERRQRDANPQGLTGWWRKGMTGITSRMDDRALRRVDAIQVMNPWMLDYARTINANRDIDIRYAPPGVDADRYRPVDQSSRMREPYILCVGRLDDPRKHIELLLEAYARLPAEVRDRAKLVLAGSANPPPTFWQRVTTLSLGQRVSFIERPDADALLSLYQHANVFVLPSDEEGFGMVVIEAMACGVPVVATRCGGPDGIITDGVDGYLVSRDDATAMSARLAELLQNPVRNAAMGTAARATVEQRHDERVAGAVFIDVWDRLLHKARAKTCVA